MTFYIIMFGIGIVLVIANLIFLVLGIKTKKYGWATTHAVLAILTLYGVMSNLNAYNELSQIESRQAVMKITAVNSNKEM